MARPQTENLKAFDQPRQSWTPDGLPSGLNVRVLNEDKESGALSAMIHLPAGWSWDGPGFCESNQDFFVFEGAIQIGDHDLGNGCFCYYPAGVVQSGWHAKEDCCIYAIFNRRPIFVSAQDSREGAETEKTVPFVDSWAMDWFDPLSASAPSVKFRPGIFVKVLRVDPDDGTSTHLAGLMPGWYAEGIEVHPVREESLVISGDVKIALVDGKPGYTVTVGGFYSRPAGVPHGPLASKNGNVGIVHTEGLLGIDYQDDPKAMDRIFDHLRSYPWN